MTSSASKPPVQNSCKTTAFMCKTPRIILRISRAKLCAKLLFTHQTVQNPTFSTIFYRFPHPLFHHPPLSRPPQDFFTIPQPLPLLQLYNLIERN